MSRGGEQTSLMLSFLKLRAADQAAGLRRSNSIFAPDADTDCEAKVEKNTRFGFSPKRNLPRIQQAV